MTGPDSHTASAARRRDRGGGVAKAAPTERARARQRALPRGGEERGESCRSPREGSRIVGLSRRVFNRPSGLCALLTTGFIAVVLVPHAAATAHSFAFEKDAASWYRTTRDNADYQANECLRHGLV